MKVIVLRHGIALARERAAQEGVADEDRPLTPKGRRRLKQVAAALARRFPDVDSIVTSPLLRAAEAAEIVAEAYGDLSYERTAALVPEADLDELSSYLNDGSRSAVMVVGHEPHLSLWVSQCLTGQRHPVLELRKGGACELSFDGPAAPGAGRLTWLLPPALLRRLARH